MAGYVFRKDCAGMLFWCMAIYGPIRTYAMIRAGMLVRDMLKSAELLCCDIYTKTVHTLIFAKHLN